MEMPKTGEVLFLEHQKRASHQIWPHIRIPRPSFSLKPVKTNFLLHGNAENPWSSIFGSSKNGVTPNLTSYSDFPSLIYPKPVKTIFYYMEMPKNPEVVFLEHQKTASHQIWPHIRIPRPSFTLKPVKTRFLLHGNAENRWSSIFGTSKKRRHTKSDLIFGFPVLHLP